MIIKNALTFMADGSFAPKHLRIDGAQIAEVMEPCSDDTLNQRYPHETMRDARGLYAIPGLTDMHFHGCMGHDFCEGTPEAFDAICAYEAAAGITTVCPATMTLSRQTLTGICAAAANYRKAQQEAIAASGRAAQEVIAGAGRATQAATVRGAAGSALADGNAAGAAPAAMTGGNTADAPDPGAVSKCAELAGINLEGPFISMEKKGAQNPKFITPPDIDMFYELYEASEGLVRTIAIAPEEPGAMEFIDALKDKTVISIAHTTAGYDIANEALDRGARHATHLYNAMPPFSHRAPGVIGAACDHDNCHVELICDGVHIHPSTVRATFQMFGDDRIILISDSMEATGMPDGQYSLGGLGVTVRGNLATLQDGTIAGSATNLMDCLRTAVKTMGIPLASAVKCAAVNPAKEIGIYDRYGSLEPGKAANIVLLDEELNTAAVYLRGKLL